MVDSTPTASFYPCIICCFSSKQLTDPELFENSLLGPEGIQLLLYIQSQDEVKSRNTIFRYNSDRKEIICEIESSRPSKKDKKIVFISIHDVTKIENGRGNASTKMLPESIDDSTLFYISVKGKGKLHLQGINSDLTAHAVRCFNELYISDMQSENV